MAGRRAGGTPRWRWGLRLAALAIPGFGLGVLAGLVWEEPGLVASYALGRTEAVEWAAGQPAAEPELPPVAAEPRGVASEPTPPTPKSAPVKASAPANTGGAVAKKPAVSNPVSAGSPRGFAVQVGAFSERAGADRLAADLRGKGYRVYLSAGESGAAQWRVRVGPAASREEAGRTASHLKQSEKLPTWVLEEAG